MKKRCLWLAGALLILGSPWCYGFELYVHSSQAPLFSEPAAGARQIVHITRGTRLEGVAELGQWFKVIYGGHEGYVYKLMVKRTKPLDKTVIRKEQIEDLEQSARRRPSAYSSTAAARGLRQHQDDFASQHEMDYQAVERMESIQVSDEEAKDFIKQETQDEEGH
jgi:hypothetical protein